MKAERLVVSWKRRCVALVALLSVVIDCSLAQTTPPRFTKFSANIPETLPGAVADWGDYDGDGDLDAVVTGGRASPDQFKNVKSGPLRVYRNDAGIFTDLKLPLGDLDGRALWADFDKDGRLDIILAGTSGASSLGGRWEDTDYRVGIYRQVSPSSFSFVSNSAFGEWSSRKGVGTRLPITSIEKVADLDGDGWEDIISSVKASPETNERIATIRYCLNRAGKFSADACVGWRTKLSYKTSTNARPIFIDLNRDGMLDIILGSNMLVQKPRLEFTAYGIDVTPNGILSVDCADLNGDSFPEIMYTTSQGNLAPQYVAKVLINNKSGGFSNSTTSIVVPFPYLTLGDLDRDGDQDIVSFSALKSSDYAVLMENRGNNTWVEHKNVIPAEPMWSARWVDLDGDNDLDIQYESPRNNRDNWFILNPLASISGRVAQGGAAVRDVTLNISSADAQLTATNSKGRYSFLFLTPGTYEVTPFKIGFSFSPSTRTIQFNGATVPEVDFEAVALTPTSIPSATPTVYSAPSAAPTAAPTQAPQSTPTPQLARTSNPTPPPTPVVTKAPIVTPVSTRAPTPKPTTPPRYTPRPVCGDGICNEDNVCSCPDDCSRFQWACTPYCGDGTCSSTESCSCSDCRYTTRCMGGGYYGSPTSGGGGWTPPAGRPCMYPAPGVKICI